MRSELAKQKARLLNVIFHSLERGTANERNV